MTIGNDRWAGRGVPRTNNLSDAVLGCALPVLWVLGTFVVVALWVVFTS